MDLTRTLAGSVCARLEQEDRATLVAICGWADTGKSTLAAHLRSVLAETGVSSQSISTDDFMLDRAQRYAAGINGYDPRSLDVAGLEEALRCFLSRRPFSVNPYDNRAGTKSVETKTVLPAQVLIVEGIHSFHPRISELTNFKLFIDSDEATLRRMRYRANIEKRGMTAGDAAARIASEWEDYSVFVRPRIEVADMIVTVDSDFHYRAGGPDGTPKCSDA